MPAPGNAGLVMLTGSSAGSGKSPAMLGPAARYRQFGKVFEVSEDDLWGTRELGTAPVDRTTASPLFFDLLHGEAAQDVGPEAVITAFYQLQEEALRRPAVWLQDWYLVKLWRGGEHSTLELAELFSVSRTTVYRAIQRGGAGSPGKAT